MRPRCKKVIWHLAEHAVDATPPRGRVVLQLERIGPDVRITIRHASGAQSGAVATIRPIERTRIDSVVEHHGGRFQITGPSGDEDTVAYWIDLPLRAVAGPAPVAASRQEAPPAAPVAPAQVPLLANLLLLVIDDQRDARELLEALLEPHGAIVVQAPGGGDAIAWLNGTPREEWPDAIVCDVAMGEQDGYATIAEIRALESRRGIALTERVPAIALTGFARAEDRVRALLAGFQLHLSKPVDPVELVMAIRSFARPRFERSR